MSKEMIVGKVKEIWRYPVKSMAGQRLDACAVTTNGVLGDRGWAFRDDQRSEISTARKIPELMRFAARYREEPAPGAIPHGRYHSAGRDGDRQ